MSNCRTLFQRHPRVSALYGCTQTVCTFPLRSNFTAILSPSLRTTSQLTLSFIPAKRLTGLPSTARILSERCSPAFGAGGADAAEVMIGVESAAAPGRPGPHALHANNSAGRRRNIG